MFIIIILHDANFPLIIFFTKIIFIYKSYIFRILNFFKKTFICVSNFLLLTRYMVCSIVVETTSIHYVSSTLNFHECMAEVWFCVIFPTGQIFTNLLTLITFGCWLLLHGARRSTVFLVNKNKHMILGGNFRFLYEQGDHCQSVCTSLVSISNS